MSVFILEHVSKSFKNDKTEQLVLNDINLILPDKGLISILGKSGSGKSTLLNILMGIEKPSKGKIFFEGKDISKYNDRKFSKYHLNSVSLIFQHYNLFNDFTALENVILPLKMKGVKVNRAKQEAKQLFARFGIEKLLNRKVNKLSGGEKQRIAIIRSLITKPKAILCDEPTGALDYKNSCEIMGILKEISDKTLVIMVSHNIELVRKYSDEILTLKDGQFVNDINLNEQKFTTRYFKTRTSYKSKWTNKFLRHNLLKNFKKNLFSIISCCISFSAMFISFGFSEGSRASQEEALKRNLSIGYATASETEFIDLEGSPLQFQKTKRPELSLIDSQFRDFTSIRVEENYSYLISNAPTCIFDEKTINNFQMIPVFDISLTNYGSEMLKNGRTGDGSFEEILINEEFQNLFDKDMLNETITLSNNSTINFSTGNEDNPFIKDSLNLNKKLKIVGILREFPFLNTPKIYFSYSGAKQFLKSEMMENLSNYKGEFYSYYDYIEDCNSDDPVSSYSSYIFLENLDELDKFYEHLKNQSKSSLQITSSALEIKDTYTTFINSFSTTLIIFIVIAFIGINLILGMISLSTFIENKKTTAIMTCLGARNKSIYSLYLSENIILILISFISSLGVSFVLQKFLNVIIYNKFSLNNLIDIPYQSYFGIPFGLVIFLFLVALIFSFIFTLTPMVIYRSRSITDELRDE